LPRADTWSLTPSLVLQLLASFVAADLSPMYMYYICIYIWRNFQASKDVSGCSNSRKDSHKKVGFSERQVARGHHRGELCSAGEDSKGKTIIENSNGSRASVTEVQGQQDQARLFCSSRSPSFLLKIAAMASCYNPSRITAVCSTGEDCLTGLKPALRCKSS
jgi:hypothetical protein